MKIIVADYAGFCFGVKRAVELAEEAARLGTVASIGPLIHNKWEVERLQKLGLSELRDFGDNDDEENQPRPVSVLIRTHGVGPHVYELIKKQGFRIIDATCPHVSKAQTVAKEAQANGYQVIIFGDKNHPEVQGIQGWTGDQAVIISSLEELDQVRQQGILADKVAVLAQTTEKEERFAEIIRYLQENVPDLQVLSTICAATRLRQEAVAKLAQDVDLMIVIGGKNSSNTQKLAEACRSKGIPTYFIERGSELERSWFQENFHVGVTAGSSTPDWIIKEVIEQMEEMNKINEDQYDIKSYQPGDMVEGVVVQINNDEVLVDIGGKSEGIIPVAELAGVKVNPKEYLQLGQKIMVEVIKEDREGNLLLSHKNAFFEEALNKIEKAKETGAILEATVTDVVKGGLLVDVGIKGFVPASQVERGFVEDLSVFLQKKLRVRVLELDREKKKVVLSQRVILDEEYEQKRKALWEEIKEGETRKGIVKKIMNFGAFVDIGGIDGLLHITELGWKRVNHPSEVLHEGDNVEVYVLKVDHEKEKVSLSLKKLAADPWMEGISKYEEGSVVKGKVVRILPFGAFVQLEPGLEGLVHISQISEKRINKVEDVLEVGQEINVKIVQISEEDKRIKLSMKDIVKDEEKEEITTFLNEQSEADDNVTIGDLVKTINLKNETEENKAVAKTKTEEAPKAVEIKTNESNDPDEDVVNNESTKKLGKTKKAEK
ncbi:MAG: bifunctional 4-hydroxy-3-methylbut-2-enyl diphosphate reductase/30S ribosomal protein S1 [Peptococcia bacterium]